MSMGNYKPFQALLLFLAALCVFSDGQPPAKTGVFANISRLEKTVVRIRNRAFTRSCKKGVKTTTELKDFLTTSYDTEYPPAVESFYETLWHEFKLVPADFKLKETLVTLLTTQIGGFYDPETRALYVAEKSMSFSDIILVHELTHALQDCHLPLNSLLYLEDLGFKKSNPIRNDDINLARVAFIEGEAQLVTSQFIASRGRVFTPDYLRKNDYGYLVSSHIQMSLTPPVIANSLMFPYTRGLSFAETLYRLNGWKTVNYASRRLPRSTEQIIHPEKYIRGESPIMIRIKPIRALIASGWKRSAENCMGEFMVNEIVRTLTGCFARAVRASCGWGGDSLVVFTKGQQKSLLWYTVWDTTKDADEFYKYLSEGLDKLQGNKATVLPSPKGSRCVKDSGRFRWLKQSGKDVLYASTPDEEVLTLMRLLNPELIQKLTWNECFPPQKDLDSRQEEELIEADAAEGVTHD